MQYRNKINKRGGGSLNHFYPSSSWEMGDHWWIKWTSLELGRLQAFFLREVAAGITLTAFCSALKLYGQTETADRVVTVKEEDYRAC